MLNVNELIGFNVHNNVVDFSFIGSSVDNTNLATYTFSSHSIGTPSPDRAILISILGGGASGGGEIVSSVTVGGKPLNKVVEVSYQPTGNPRIASMWIGYIPDSSSADIVVSFSGPSNTVARCRIGVYRIVGLSTLSPKTTNTASVTATSASASLGTVGSNTLCVSCAYGNRTGGNNTTWTGVTENFDSIDESNNNLSGGSKLTTIEESIIPSVSYANTNEIALVSASWG